MDLGGSARSKQSGSPLAAIALTLALVVALIGAVWFVSNAGLVGGTAAKPVGDRSYDAIEAQRGAIERLVTVTSQTLARSQAAAQYDVSRLSFSMAPGTFQPGKAADDQVLAPVAVPLSPTSGTFHPGKAADDQVLAPVDRPGVSGP
jgi:hypothetical protein